MFCNKQYEAVTGDFSPQQGGFRGWRRRGEGGVGQSLRVLFDLAGAGGGPRQPLEVPLRLLRERRRHLSHSLLIKAGPAFLFVFLPIY
jgi:hypothetical protein